MIFRYINSFNFEKDIFDIVFKSSSSNPYLFNSNFSSLPVKLKSNFLLKAKMFEFENEFSFVFKTFE